MSLPLPPLLPCLLRVLRVLDHWFACCDLALDFLFGLCCYDVIWAWLPRYQALMILPGYLFPGADANHGWVVLAEVLVVPLLLLALDGLWIGSWLLRAALGSEVKSWGFWDAGMAPMVAPSEIVWRHWIPAVDPDMFTILDGGYLGG